jgi:pyrimidine deaminase RibD-like protein
MASDPTDDKKCSATDLEFMAMAIEEARHTPGEPGRSREQTPFVGIVVVKDGVIVGKGFRGKTGPGEHAEYGLLEKTLAHQALAGATAYVTLEPCSSRGPTKIPCARRLIERKFEKVFIGVLDPDPNIQGNGYRMLREANITVELFPENLQNELEELNREFTRFKRAPRSPKPSLRGRVLALSSVAVMCVALSGLYAAWRHREERELAKATLVRLGEECDRDIEQSCAALRSELEKRCEGDEWNSCAVLAVLLDRHQPCSNQSAQSGQLLERSCAGASQNGCNLLAAKLLGACGIERDPRRAVLILSRQCHIGLQSSCDLLAGAAYSNPEVLAASDIVQVLEDACEAHVTTACTRLGVMLARGVAGKGREDERAFKLFRDGCSKKNMNACVNMGQFYLEGRGGVGVDPKRALDLFAIGCTDREFSGCSNIAKLELASSDGGGVSADSVRHLRDACRFQDGSACYVLALVVLRQQQPMLEGEVPAVLLENACQFGEPAGCYGLALWLRTAEPGSSRVTKLIQQSCKMGNLEACAEAR